MKGPTLHECEELVPVILRFPHPSPLAFSQLISTNAGKYLKYPEILQPHPASVALLIDL
ncbi:MAG: hypothetical protein F2923_06335 [Actinobacteria bacterium]|nr:hypothetical protein [Actinomycetota bacterium]